MVKPVLLILAAFLVLCLAAVPVQAQVCGVGCNNDVAFVQAVPVFQTVQFQTAFVPTVQVAAFNTFAERSFAVNRVVSFNRVNVVNVRVRNVGFFGRVFGRNVVNVRVR